MFHVPRLEVSYCENDNTTKCNLHIQFSSYQITSDIFHWTITKYFTFCRETQRTLNNQSNLEIKEWSWRNRPSWLQTILQSYSHQDSMVLAQKRKDRLMEQDRKSRNKPIHPWASSLTKDTRIYNGEKIISSIYASGKVDSYV